MKPGVKEFESLSYEEIVNLPPAAYDDSPLLDISDHFFEQDDERQWAVFELILSSPDNDEMIDYSGIYQDVVDMYMFIEDYPAARRWAYTWLVYSEQHEAGANRSGCIHRLAESYLCDTDPDIGTGMFIRRIHIAPGELTVYFDLAQALWQCDQNDLARNVIQRGLELSNEAGDQKLREELEKLSLDIDEDEPQTRPDREIDPHWLSELDRALALRPVGETAKTEPYLPPLKGWIEKETAEGVDPKSEILAQAKLFAPELIQIAFDPAIEDRAIADWAVSLLREFHPAMLGEFSGILNWLDRADGDWKKDRLLERFGKIGGYTTAELQRFIANPECAEFIRSSALDSLGERLANCPQQRAEILDFLRRMLARPELDEAREEYINGCIVALLLDIDGRELYPEVKALFDRDRVDPILIGLEDVELEWELPLSSEPGAQQDGLHLFLECLACGRTRRHFTKYVLAETDSLDMSADGQPTPYTPFILDHEVQCPKCGAKDRYEVASLSKISLLAPSDPSQLAQLFTDKEPSGRLRTNPRVFYFRGAALGEEMHPFEALARYEWEIAKKPKDADLHLGFGNTLRFLSRHAAALNELRLAHELKPNDPEISFMLAMAEHDFGDRQAAKECYQKAISLDIQSQDPPKGRSFIFEFDEQNPPIHISAMEGLQALERGKPSPWFLAAYNSEGVALTDFLASKARDSGMSKSQKRKASRKRR
jgi:tetratricopeptide (TPR) repeat protein